MSCTDCATCMICKKTPNDTKSRRLYCEVCDMYCCNRCCWKCESKLCKTRVCVLQRVTCRDCNESVCWACLSKSQYRICLNCEELAKTRDEPMFQLDPDD